MTPALPVRGEGRGGALERRVWGWVGVKGRESGLLIKRLGKKFLHDLVKCALDGISIQYHMSQIGRNSRESELLNNKL